MQKLYRGPGSLTKGKDALEKLGVTRPLVVYSARLRAQVEQEMLPGVPCVFFSAYKPNPLLTDCLAARDLYVQENCDGIVSLGGGSAMDSAKAVKAYLLAQDEAQVLRSDWETRPLPHLAVPTTAGTGSEATRFAVMYHGGEKKSLDHPSLLPDAVILDPALLATLPPYHKKACALDALCQGIESYWAKAATEDSQVDAFLAFTGVMDNLRAYLAGDEHAAAELQYAAYRSGCAIDVSRTTAAHAMSYKLTSLYGIAHGHACMLTLPAIWEAMLDDTDVLPVLMDLAQKLRLGSELLVPKLLWGMLYDLDLEIPQADDATLALLTDSVNAQRLANNPRAFTPAELRAIYQKSLTQKCANERQACLDIWRYYR